MSRQEAVKIIRSELSRSDIVWSRYGSDSINDLAKRIAEKLSYDDDDDDDELSDYRQCDGVEDVF